MTPGAPRDCSPPRVAEASPVFARVRGRNWLVWFLGLALLGAVLVAAAHFAEEREFARLLEEAHPWWLLLAVALQASTYLAEGEVWRSVVRAGGSRIPIATAYQLGLAKLFVDQAIPTGGISGTIFFVQGLERAGVAAGTALAGVVVATFSYYGGYVLCLAGALVLASAGGYLTGPVAAVAAIFLILSTAFAVIILLQSAREPGPIDRWFSRVSVLRRVLDVLHRADPTLAHSPSLIHHAIGWQIAIVLLDAATIWVLLLAVGASAPPATVFTSYMFSSLFRTMSIVPGGLGVFEAASVFILRSAGTPLAAALSATLLFRGLSFWLPMLPGILFARRVTRAQGPFARKRTAADHDAS